MSSGRTKGRTASWTSTTGYFFERARNPFRTECVRSFPLVFDPGRRRWIQLEHAQADEIAAVVRRCPTGALQAWPTGQAAASTAAPGVTITLADDGPLLIAGNVRVVDARGVAVAGGSKLALCRCGATGNAPLCDGSHKRVGYVSPKREEKR